jgi:hypothetical protein
MGRGPGTIAECARNARRAGLIGTADNNALALCGCKCAGNAAERACDLAGHCSAAADCAIYSAGIGRRSGTIAECRDRLVGAPIANTLCGRKCTDDAAERAYDLAGRCSAAADCTIHSGGIGRRSRCVAE